MPTAGYANAFLADFKKAIAYGTLRDRTSDKNRKSGIQKPGFWRRYWCIGLYDLKNPVSWGKKSSIAYGTLRDRKTPVSLLGAMGASTS